jgi:xanthine dehydrogenase YagR molybdenum-binding subunit
MSTDHVTPTPAVGRPATPPSTIREAPRRLDAPDKVSGRARYAVEYDLPGAAYAWPVQATISRGRIVSVEAAAARGVPRVLAVLTAQNAPRLDAAGAIAMAHAGALPDLLLMQDDRVHFRGQIVAAVIAETLESAREAASLVDVVYSEEEPELAAVPDDARSIVPELTNDLSPGRVERGTPLKALAAAPVQVDQTYTTSAQFAQPMEPHAATAQWETADRLTLYSSDQGPYWTAVTFAALFGLATDHVEVVAEYVGGGFGSKAAPRPPAMLAAMASQLVGRPVKVALDRPQSSTLTTHRSRSTQRVRLGAERDGTITSIVHEVTGQSSRLLPYVDQTVSMSRILYDAPHSLTVSRVVQLDIPTPGWVRAPGEAPGLFALESAMDELAHELGHDPVELRIRNEPEVDPESGLPFSSRSLVRCLRTGAERFGWSDRDPRPGARHDSDWYYGMGVASAAYPVLLFPSTATIVARSHTDFDVEIGAADIGTGSRTVLHQLAAEALGVPIESVQLKMGRSSRGLAPFAGGSTGTGSWGWAIHQAALQVKSAMARQSIPPEGLRVTVDTAEAAMQPPQHSRQSYGAQFAQVRVNRYTGEVFVDRLLGVFAGGRIINHATARSQVVGGMIMGLGMALTETAELDTILGGWVTQDLASYHIPAHADIPDIDVVFLEETDLQVGPTGGKGIGEIGIVGVTAAITNAVFNATGIRVRNLPALPDRMSAALNALPHRAS